MKEIDTIREALEYYMEIEVTGPGKEALDALSTIEADAKPQEPSEDARIFAHKIFNLVDQGDLFEGLDDAAALITAHDDAIRRECAERFTQEWRNAFPALDDTPPEWTITAILGKEAKK